PGMNAMETDESPSGDDTPRQYYDRYQGGFSRAPKGAKNDVGSSLGGNTFKVSEQHRRMPGLQPWITAKEPFAFPRPLTTNHQPLLLRLLRLPQHRLVRIRRYRHRIPHHQPLQSCLHFDKFAARHQVLISRR